jgi:hypothetical protein
MTSTIKVNNIQNQCGANIINENSNTITLGASGDTIALASGASQTGFGREGSVDWQTSSIKTATFTATSGEGYFCNTSGGAFTVNLPAGSAGAIVSLADYTRTFATNNLTVSPNGSEKIGGVAGDAKLNVNGQSATFVYVDATEGWINTQETQTSQTGLTGFIMASGGTETESGDFKIHTFTGPGTFQVTAISCTAANNTVGYQVVGGGGGGTSSPSLRAGGGGAGGFREGRNVPVDNFTASPLVANAPTNAVTVTATSFPITVGGGGAAATGGANSTFSTITSAGGGKGGEGQKSSNPEMLGGNGGSGGGGGSGNGCGNFTTGGTGNTPPVSPSQGNNGGGASHTYGAWAGGGGGGGASAVGGTATAYPSPGPSASAGVGGAGVSSSITGSSIARAGGGGGGGTSCGAPTVAGGTGGGGSGQSGGGGSSTAGTANTGGGGGGGGSAGGSGIVIIRYKFK